jgi:F-type H+-transporting ATPase subunit a
MSTNLYTMSLKSFLYTFVFCLTASFVSAQQHPSNSTHTDSTANNNQQAHGETAAPHSGAQHAGGALHDHDACSPAHDTTDKYDPVPAIMHHIGDAHQFEIIPNVLTLPLPVFAYDTEGGLTSGFSTMFHHGAKAVNGFVLSHDVVKRAIGLPKGEVELEVVHTDEEGHAHYSFMKEEAVNGEKVENHYVRAAGQCYKLEEGRGLTNLKSSWIDFSITKNVFTMILALGLIGFVFMRVANYYKNNVGKAPKGLTNMMEIFITFIRDDVAKPSIGPKYEKYMPLLLSLFFFILINNLLGLIPIFPGSSNVTGNISVTIVLALVVFIVTTVSGNKNYWQHVFWMPGVPTFVKVLMAPIEIATLFIKPFTLLIRLFANVTAGHVIILTLVSLIFIFGNAGKSLGGSIMGVAIAVPFAAFMNLLELLVAFLQAFIFTLLSALYIGSAVEEHHHDDSHAH